LRDDVRLKLPALEREIAASVYLPAAYGKAGSTARQFPVVYLLHGLGDDHRAWPRLGRIKATLDRMIDAKTLRPMVVVMPDAGKSWYVNDARANGNGPVFDAFRGDLFRAVERRFRVLACPDGRAVGGLSMGGYGGVLLGTAAPRAFAAVFSLSGAFFTEKLSDDPGRRAWLLSLYNGVHGTPPQPERLATWSIFNRLAAITPDRNVPPVWLSTADDDGFPSILPGNVRAFQILKSKGVTAELRVDDGGHDWRYWRVAIVPALKWSDRHMKAACP
ncbi:MAG: alpha/beta hydrolase-fold protein, partial [Pseudomonadota bacterium]